MGKGVKEKTTSGIWNRVQQQIPDNIQAERERIGSDGIQRLGASWIGGSNSIHEARIQVDNSTSKAATNGKSRGKYDYRWPQPQQ